MDYEDGWFQFTGEIEAQAEEVVVREGVYAE